MRSFDRVAEVYDRTRELPRGVPERVADRVIAATRVSQRSRFLEVGVGTGRIALPFLERGYRYTGVDIAERMMDRLRAKVRDREVDLTLVNADVAAMPFESGEFDVVMAVHVLHLLAEWRAALKEMQRVLSPDGSLVLGYDRTLPGDPAGEIRGRWNDLVTEAGVSLPDWGGRWSAVDAELSAAGAYTAVYRAAAWESDFRPIDLLEEQRSRVYSRAWEVPDDVLEAVHRRLVAWVTDTYGPPEQPVRSRSEFMVSVSRFTR
jgi:SAM-dependent methyltransferase